MPDASTTTDNALNHTQATASSRGQANANEHRLRTNVAHDADRYDATAPAVLLNSATSHLGASSS
eukprot:13167-Heterococcus_DN1.PRE.6